MELGGGGWIHQQFLYLVKKLSSPQIETIIDKEVSK
jgi:hypothetical protein